MSISKYFEWAWVKGEKRGLPPRVKMILAFAIVLLAISPVILGIYWDLFLGK